MPHRFAPAAVVLLAALAGSPATAFAAGGMEAGKPFLDTLEPAALRLVEQRGFAFGAAFGRAGAASNGALHDASAAYRQLAATVTADVAELRRDMEATGRRLYEITDGNVGRVFETAWMSAPTARFGLVGVVLRLDRRDFAPAARRRRPAAR